MLNTLPVQLTVERVTGWPLAASFVDEWDRLVNDRCPGAVFRSPAWLLPWWETFRGNKRLRLLTARRGGLLEGILPAYRLDGPLGPQLRLLGDNVVGSDYLGVVARPSEIDSVAASIADFLLDNESDGWFANLLEDDPLARVLVERAGARLVETRPLYRCRYLRVEMPFEAWLGSLPGGMGAQWRRRQRWLARQPGYHLDVVSDPAGLASALEILFRLHRARWNGASDGIVDERTERFHRRALAGLAQRGWARLYVLHVAGAPRAVLYGFERGGRFSFYQSGRDPAWARRSVGTVVMVAALEDSFRRGLEFDFLHGEEPYKSVFATVSRQLIGVRYVRGRRARLRRALERVERTARLWVRRTLLGRGEGA